MSSDFEEVIGLADRIVVLSDGVSVTEFPSRLLDIEKLAMFAAPRSSAERTHTVLDIAGGKSIGGVAYWIAIERGRVYCFDKVGDDPPPTRVLPAAASRSSRTPPFRTR